VCHGPVGKGEAAGMARHVGMRLECEPDRGSPTLDQLGEASIREGARRNGNSGRAYRQVTRSDLLTLDPDAGPRPVGGLYPNLSVLVHTRTV
jgi:hypothetical protein